MIQQIAPRRSAAIADQFTICPNDPVTRNDDGYSVIPIHFGHCPDRIGKTDRFNLPRYVGSEYFVYTIAFIFSLHKN